MKIEKFKHENVLPDGTFINKAGEVETNGKILISKNNGSCDLNDCKCSEGHWITIVQPRTKEGIVEGLKVKFDSKVEMQKLLCGRVKYTKEKFITERTKIISEMLDNPDKYEIYPTTKCFEQLDKLFDKITN